MALVPLAVSAQTRKAPPRSSTGAKSAPSLAVMPGFETLADGSTRLFVDLSGPVAYDTKTDHGATSYVLKDTRVAKQNNCNPLVTEFFNTPVTNARLVVHGHDLWLVTETRSKVDPAVSIDTEADGGAAFSVRYPKGDYLPAQAPPPLQVADPSGGDGTSPASPSSPAANPAARPPVGGRGRGGAGGGGGGGRSGHRSRGTSQ
jgi:hypothetical protein